MNGKKLIKGLFATAALALTIMVTPASIVKAEGAQSTYTVERGDNLSKIAKKIYGNEKYWKVIYEANSGVVKGDYIIYKNQVLIIPAVDGIQNSAAPAVTTPSPETVAPAATTPAPAQAAATPESAVVTPAPTPAPAPAVSEQEYTLDYNAIGSWVDGGFIGVDASNSPVVMALDAESEYAVIIFGDNSDMTAVSFAGPVTYTGEFATITDEANGLALTFSVAEVNETTLALDMGDVGSAVIAAATKEEVLSVIKAAIENYKHVA